MMRNVYTHVTPLTILFLNLQAHAVVDYGTQISYRGSSVTLRCYTDNGLLSVNWYNDTIANPTNRIATWAGGPVDIKPPLVGRGTLDTSTGSLTISNIRVTDDGDYLCQVYDNGANLHSATTRLLVEVRPDVISISGLGSPVLENRPVSVSMSIYPVKLSSYSIYYKIGNNNPVLIQNPTKTARGDGTNNVTASVSLTLTKNNNSQQFQCLVTKQGDPNTVYNTSSVQISVYYRAQNSISITGSTEPIEGGSITLQCAGTANPAVSSVQWKKGSNIISVTSPKYSRPSTTQLTMSSLVTTDNGQYSCAGVNDIGAALGGSGFGSFSSSISIGVLYKCSVSSCVATKNPVTENDVNIELRCSTVDCNPSQLASVTWKKNNTNIVLDSTYYTGGIPSQPALTIKRIRKSDAATYTVDIRNRIGGKNVGSLDLVVHYCPQGGNPGIQLNQNKLEYKVTTEQIQLSCHPSDSGNPAAHQYVWTKENNNSFSHTTSTSSWSFTPYSVKDSGRYRCQGKNTVSGCTTGQSQQSTAAVSIRTPPQIESYTLSSSSPMFNDSMFSMECTASGDPAVSILWQKDGESVSNTDFILTHSEVTSGPYSYDQDRANKSVLQWRSSEKMFTCQNISYYSGSYSCVAKGNGIGNDVSQEKNVQVSYPPIWRGQVLEGGQPVNYAATADSNVVIECNVCANPPPLANQYQWSFNGTSLRSGITSNGRNVTIDNVGNGDFGIYTCTATNGIGGKFYSSTFNIMLEERGPPHTPVGLHVLEQFTTSTSVSLKWTAGANGGYLQSFTVQYKKSTDSKYTIHQQDIKDLLQPGSTFNTSITGLTPNQLYNIQVISVNERPRQPRTSQPADITLTTEVSPIVNLTKMVISDDGKEVKAKWEIKRGKPRKLKLLYKKTSEESFGVLKDDIPADYLNITVKHDFDLQSRYTFKLQIYEGAQLMPSVISAAFVTEPFSKDEPGPSPVAGIVSGVVAAIVIVIAIVIVMIFLRRRQQAKKDPEVEMSGNREYHRVDDNGSGSDIVAPYTVEYRAQERQGGGATGVEGLYAQPDKKKKQEKREPDPSALYAQPEKKKKGKVQDEELQNLYAQPDKNKKKKKKAEPKPSSYEDENPYQNVENKNDLGENPYANVDDERQVQEEEEEEQVEESTKNIGPDGTVYADLAFTRPKGKKPKDEIIRTEEATEYATIDFKRKPPPSD